MNLTEGSICNSWDILSDPGSIIAWPFNWLTDQCFEDWINVTMADDEVYSNVLDIG